MTCLLSISIAAGVRGSRCYHFAIHCWQIVTESKLEAFACVQRNFASQGVVWGWITFKIDIFLFMHGMNWPFTYSRTILPIASSSSTAWGRWLYVWAIPTYSNTNLSTSISSSCMLLWWINIHLWNYILAHVTDHFYYSTPTNASV